MNQTATLTWTAAGTPVSARFDDPYFSLDAGLDETRHVFLSGNDLPARLGPGFHVGELGFGTGLNLLALAQVWQGPGMLRFTSFEAFPISAEEMARALAPFALPQTEALIRGWGASHGACRKITLNGIDAEILIGDARETLPAWTGRVDAWFLDGFSPAKNPELWEPALLRAVAHHSAPGATLATYSAAGAVRRNLEAAGFAITRRPGFGRKRHMTTGTLKP